MFAKGTEFIIKLRSDDETIATGGFDSVHDVMTRIRRSAIGEARPLDVWNPADDSKVVPCIFNSADISSIADVRGLDIS